MRQTLVARALEAVHAGAVRHAHPFTWGVDSPFLDVKPRTLQTLAGKALIKVEAHTEGYWRPVRLTESGQKYLASTQNISAS